MKNTSDIVIKNIKKYLEITKQTQSDLARFLSVPRQTVNRIINNERDITANDLDKVAEFFHIEVNDLYKDNLVKLEKKQILYHGSPEKKFNPTFGLGDKRHDYGQGFYLSFDKELAKEWAVCKSDKNGYLHQYKLNTNELKILYLNEKYGVLSWLAVLALHRQADSSKKYLVNADKLIKKYLPKDIDKFDVIVGYRADDSYYSFAKNAIKGGIDISLLEQLMKKGDLGYQVFLQSKKAFKQIKEIEYKNGYLEEVDHDEYFIQYDERDHQAREEVAALMNSDRNTLKDTIEKYLD